MKHASHIALMSVLAVTAMLTQACGTLSVSGAGEEEGGRRERIVEPAIKDIPPQDVYETTSRTSPAMRAELSARNATGFRGGSLVDVLFDFDRATIRTDALPVLEADAKQLQKDGSKRVLLEGRGDEVGTAAYNLVLGERRARSVKAYLQQMGLSADLKTATYGKDRPLCFQHSEDCLQKNRSVHFVVKD